ncbi:MAG: inositol monophosphatase family protein [Zestosphaera sp.]
MLEILKAAARRVGDYLTEIRRSSITVGVNASGDTSKEFDVVSERLIFEELRKGVEDCFIFVSEESGVQRFCEEPKWVIVVDPVDGSINYEASIPWVSVSIAAAPLAEDVSVGDIEYAVVYDIYRKINYSFGFDEGVLVSGAPASRRPKPPEVVLGYFEVPRAYRIIPEYWVKRGSRASLRSLGSAALDIIHVGLGNAEAFIDTRAKLRNVDVAAALRIALALGAKARVCEGSDALSIHLNSVRKVECILVGFNEHYLERLSEAYVESERVEGKS